MGCVERTLDRLEVCDVVTIREKGFRLNLLITGNKRISRMVDSRRPLKKLRKRQNQALSKYTEAIRGELTHLQRLKFKAIAVIEIHARDVIEKMYRASK